MTPLRRLLMLMAQSRGFTFVGIGTAGTSANSYTSGMPAGIASGDLLLLVGSTGGGFTPSGTWNDVLSGGSGSVRPQLKWKFASGSESDVTFTSTNSRHRAVVLAYRGAHGTPLDVAQASAATGNSTSAATTSITTTAIKDLLAGFATTSSSASYTAPGSVNERYNVACDGSTNGLVIWDEIQAAAGATSVRTATLSSSQSWAAFSAAFKPA